MVQFENWEGFGQSLVSEYEGSQVRSQGPGEIQPLWTLKTAFCSSLLGSVPHGGDAVRSGQQRQNLKEMGQIKLRP